MTTVTVLLAGVAGVGLRWAVSLLTPAYPFPIATLVVNGLGGFAMGWIQAQPGFPDHVKIVLGVGLLGAFTTFSAYSWETLKLWQAGEVGLALLNVLANNIIALGLCWLGFTLASSN